MIFGNELNNEEHLKIVSNNDISEIFDPVSRFVSNAFLDVPVIVASTQKIMAINETAQDKEITSLLLAAQYISSTNKTAFVISNTQSTVQEKLATAADAINAITLIPSGGNSWRKFNLDSISVGYALRSNACRYDLLNFYSYIFRMNTAWNDDEFLEKYSKFTGVISPVTIGNNKFEIHAYREIPFHNMESPHELSFSLIPKDSPSVSLVDALPSVRYYRYNNETVQISAIQMPFIHAIDTAEKEKLKERLGEKIKEEAKKFRIFLTLEDHIFKGIFGVDKPLKIEDYLEDEELLLALEKWGNSLNKLYIPRIKAEWLEKHYSEEVEKYPSLKFYENPLRLFIPSMGKTFTKDIETFRNIRTLEPLENQRSKHIKQMNRQLRKSGTDSSSSLISLYSGLKIFIESGITKIIIPGGTPPFPSRMHHGNPHIDEVIAGRFKSLVNYICEKNPSFFKLTHTPELEDDRYIIEINRLEEINDPLFAQIMSANIS